MSTTPHDPPPRDDWVNEFINELFVEWQPALSARFAELVAANEWARRKELPPRVAAREWNQRRKGAR